MFPHLLCDELPLEAAEQELSLRGLEPVHRRRNASRIVRVAEVHLFEFGVVVDVVGVMIDMRCGSCSKWVCGWLVAGSGRD